MASAYAALVSLMNVLHIIKHPKNPASNSHLDESQIRSLFDKVKSLVELLEAHSHCISKDLEKRMTKAAFAAEDMIETDLVVRRKHLSTPLTFQVQKSSSQEETSRRLAATGLRGHHPERKMIKVKKKSTSSLLSLDLDKAIQEMKLSINGAVQAKQNNGEQDQVLSKGLVTADVGSNSVPCGDHPHCISKDLEEKMTKLSFAAEDVIETDLMERRKSTSTPFTFQAKKSTSAAKTSRPLLTQKLDKAMQEMDLIIQEIKMQAKQNNGEQNQLQSKGLAPAIVSTPVPHGDTVKVVGLKEETNRLIDQLTSHQSNRHVIPIVGMGGLGKTTLATNVYNHPHLKHHFDVKAWVAISQVYTPRTIFAPLLHDIGVKDIDQIEDAELGLRLHKGLFGRRYLVIIDDIWDLKAWDGISRYCPDNNNGSRILLTTRHWDIANRVSSCSPLDMQLLDVDKSWDLLSKTVFDQQVVCPPEIEHCGKEIAKNCKGLPLAIVVIGGLLKVSDRTLKHWEHVGRNIRSIIGTEYNEHCMKILSLSYHQLPIHLKPCFLYMATFPEDYDIKVSELTKFWAADGFLKPSVDGKTLDEVALECLTDLISRNLVIVNKRNEAGEMTCLTVHDLVRDLCIKEAQNEKFLYVVDDGVADLESERRLVSYGNGSSCMSRHMGQMDFSRSFIWFRQQKFPGKISWFISLLRVMVSWEENFRVEDIMQLVNLRLLNFSIKKDQVKFLSSISSALNLETLILHYTLDDYCRLPVEIWNLWRLKHLIVYWRIRRVILPDPPTGSDFVHANLQTLEGVIVFGNSVLNRIPNIKILDIDYHFDDNKFVDYGHCKKLENLRFEVKIPGSMESNYNFPSCLGKLTLWSTRIPWENMTIVGSLPNLKSLYLGSYAFIGEEWQSVEGEFEKLTYLEIYGCSDLVRWIVEESSHFPSLEHLKLLLMDKLEEIPLVFGELMTLVSIKLNNCSKSAIISAREILEEQQRGGNDDLTVDVLHWIRRAEYSVELEEKLKGLSPNDNFHLTIKKL